MSKATASSIFIGVIFFTALITSNLANADFAKQFFDPDYCQERTVTDLQWSPSSIERSVWAKRA